MVTLGLGWSGEPVEVPYTDWEYLLDHIPGLNLTMDTTVAGWVRVAAFLVQWSSLAIGVWMLWEMFLARLAQQRAA